MINQVKTLETCWYLSPPWGKDIPPLTVGLLEIIYIPSTETFGYCCGFEWMQNSWSYAIAYQDNIIYKPAHEIIGIGKRQPITAKKPVFNLGELVKFRFASNGPEMRLILGIHQINGLCFYSIEWKSPEIGIQQKGVNQRVETEQVITKNRLVWVTDYELVRWK